MDLKYGPSVSITEMVKRVADDVARDVFREKSEPFWKNLNARFSNYMMSNEFERRVLEIVFGYKVDMAEKINVDCEPPRSGQPWTDAEVAQLEREVSKLVSKLADMYGRTPKAIEAKARALGLLGYKH